MAGSTESKVFTLFGGILDDGHYAGFSLATLYAFLGPLGVSEEAARLVLSRMARKGYLITRRKGRGSYYFLTEAGEAEVEAAAALSVRRREEGPWDGRFRLLSLDLPEAHREERVDLSKALAALGFARAGRDLWAAAVEPSPSLASLLRKSPCRGHATAFLAEYQGDPRAYAQGLFALKERAVGIRALKARYATLIAKVEAARREGWGPSDAECFGHYFEALESYVGLMSLIPPLPRELLPTAWPVPAAEKTYARLRDLLRPRTNAYIAANYRAFED